MVAQRQNSSKAALTAGSRAASAPWRSQAAYTARRRLSSTTAEDCRTQARGKLPVKLSFGGYYNVVTPQYGARSQRAGGGQCCWAAPLLSPMPCFTVRAGAQKIHLKMWLHGRTRMNGWRQARSAHFCFFWPFCGPQHTATSLT
jgi:hypothetical protein